MIPIGIILMVALFIQYPVFQYDFEIIKTSNWKYWIPAAVYPALDAGPE